MPRTLRKTLFGRLFLNISVICGSDMAILGVSPGQQAKAWGGRFWKGPGWHFEIRGIILQWSVSSMRGLAEERYVLPPAQVGLPVTS